VPSMVTDRGILHVARRAGLHSLQSFPKAQNWAVRTSFRISRSCRIQQLSGFQPCIVAHPIKGRGYRWPPAWAAFADMKRKVPQS